MSKQETGDHEELTGGAEAREAKRLAESHQIYQDLLRQAQRVRLDMKYDAKLVAAAIDQAEKEFEVIASNVGGRIVRRNHPKVSNSETCTVYIDECGQHTLEAKDPFKAFALGAVIVRDADADEFEAKWRGWKQVYLGSQDKLVHEPDLRYGKSAFWFKGDEGKRKAAVDALPGIVSILPFSAIACVIHRERYFEKFGNVPPNSTLPAHAYLMSLHFLAERIALTMQHIYGGAKARLILEARGPKEDAALQYEFARLFLDGTAYLSSAYFRQQFFPGLQFMGKGENNSGLQIADLLARPCAEKVLAPESDPPRWRAFREKLCAGKKTEHSILGLKIVPWEERYESIFSEE